MIATLEYDGDKIKTKINKRDEKKVRDIKNFMFLVFPRAGSL